MKISAIDIFKLKFEISFKTRFKIQFIYHQQNT